MQTLWQDLRYAIRRLRRSPGFTAVAVLTLALGIGANAAIASAVYDVLLRSLPFRDADRLVLVQETHPQAGSIAASYQDFLDWRAQSKSFANLAAYSEQHKNFAQLVINGEPRPAQTVFASADLFPTLGIAPAMGRNFLAAEDSDPGRHVAVISHRLWLSRFSGNSAAVGRTVEVNGESFTVIGVMPAGQQFPVDTDLWLPFAQLDQGERTNRQYHAADVIGRLRPGMSRNDAATELNTIATRLAQSYPVTNRSIGARVTPLRGALVGQLRPTLLALFGCVTLVLFIACANIANLLLVRATHRGREIAVRTALGATRSRLLRQFLVESLVLSFAGAGAGVLLAAAAMPLLTYGIAHITNQPFAASQTLSLSPAVLGFTALIAIVTGAVFSLLPALKTSPDLQNSLRDGQRTALAGRTTMRSLLAASEMALAVVVLFTAALLLRSLQKLLAVDPGFRTDHLLAVKIDLPANLYAEPQQVENFGMRLQEQVERLPGVTSAAITNAMPLIPSRSMTRFAVEGAPPAAPGNFPVTQLRFVSPSYFGTLGIGLRSGRMFEQRDVDDKVGMFLVNEAFAQRYLTARDPAGSRLMMDVTTPHPTAVRVIGVVANAKDLGVDADTAPVIYTAGYANGQILLVRSSIDPETLVGAIRRAVASLDRNLGISDVKTVDEVLSDSLARPRMSAMLLSFFAALSLGLAAIGVYGVLAFAVNQRTREIGVRMALGAERSQVLLLFLKQGVILILAGAAVGLMAALAVARLLGSLLFQTAPADPLAALATLLLLIGTGIAAVCIPAQRASRVDPAVALRAE